MVTASIGFHCPECVRSGGERRKTGYQMFHFDPLMVKILIVTNVILFVVGIGMGDGIQGQIVTDGLIIRGGLHANFGEWYRVITSGFLHYGFHGWLVLEPPQGFHGWFGLGTTPFLGNQSYFNVEA